MNNQTPMPGVPQVKAIQKGELYVANYMSLKDGKRATPLLQGTSVADVRARILKESEENGVYTVKVLSIRSIEDTLRGIERKWWNQAKLIAFTNRFKSLLQIQLKMQTILEIMYREGWDPVILKLLYETKVRNKFLDEAMSTMPKVFPKDYCGIINASRNLPDMSKIVGELEKLLEIKSEINEKLSSIKMSAVMPIGMGVIMLFGLSLYAEPMIVQMYSGFGAADQVPAMTVFVYSVADAILRYFLYFFGIIAALIPPIAYKYRTSESWELTIDELVLSLPVIGKVLSVFYEIQMLRVIALAKESGIPDVTAFALAAESQTNLVYKRMLENLRYAVIQNRELSPVFAQNIYLSEDVSQVYALAREGNSIGPMFHKLALSKEEHMKSLLKQAETLSAVINKLLMFGLVGAMAFTFYFPMLSVSSLATKGALKGAG